jgi:hypothetical protein
MTAKSAAVAAAGIAFSLQRSASRTKGHLPPVHNIALTVNGVHLLENLMLEDLAMQPLKLQGATGSTVAPTAIR